LKGISRASEVIMGRKAVFYTNEGKLVRCLLCPHSCFIEENQFGICKNRRNMNGELIATGYAKISAMGFDPIEKKPLFHFFPGSHILSVGGSGCNLNCHYCQNWRIAHFESESVTISPEMLCEMAINKGSIGIAFTYNEPSIWYEYVYDTAVIARKKKLKIVLVTNGYISMLPLKGLLQYVDALNIDIKSFKDKFYRVYCEGRLEYVKKTVEESIKHCHVEITALIVNGLNDTVEEINDMAYWLSGLNPLIPLHISKYYPAYKMHISETPLKTLLELRKAAMKHLKFVYLGNVRFTNNTYCPVCESIVIDRSTVINKVGLVDGLCAICGFRILEQSKRCF